MVGGLVRSTLALIAVVGAVLTATSSRADRIVVWKPLDLESERKFYARTGRQVPEELLRARDREAQERLEKLSALLAPVGFEVDKYGWRYFEGRILKVIAPVNPSAPWNSPERHPTFLFEAYGKDGEPKSTKPAIVSGLGLRISQHIDTAFDLQRLFSNRHELMAMPFGSEAHRAALFSVLDPDGSLGLSSEPSAADLRGVEEGALMRFASAGALSQRERMDLGVMDPAAPLLLFHENWKQGGARHLELPHLLMEEIARARRYPGYESSFLPIATDGFRMMYTLAIATPALAPAPQRDRATRLHVIGRSAVLALGSALDFHPSRENIRERANRNRPLMPLTTADLRDTALTILENGPVPPVYQELQEPPLARALVEVVEKSPEHGARAAALLERYIAPMPDEPRAVVEMYEPDRAACRGFLQELAVGRDKNLRAAQLLARIGWGPPDESRRVVDRLLGEAVVPVRKDARERPSRAASVERLQLVARGTTLARPDRRDWAAAASRYLDQRIAELRDAREKGHWGTAEPTFFEFWDVDRKK